MHYMVHAKCDLSKEMVFHRGGLPKEGLLYIQGCIQDLLKGVENVSSVLPYIGGVPEGLNLEKIQVFVVIMIK